MMYMLRCPYSSVNKLWTYSMDKVRSPYSFTDMIRCPHLSSINEQGNESLPNKVGYPYTG